MRESIRVDFSSKNIVLKFWALVFGMGLSIRIFSLFGIVGILLLSMFRGMFN